MRYILALDFEPLDHERRSLDHENCKQMLRILESLLTLWGVPYYLSPPLREDLAEIEAVVEQK